MDDPDFSGSVATQQQSDAGYLQSNEEIIGGESTVSIEVDPALAAEVISPRESQLQPLIGFF